MATTTEEQIKKMYEGQLESQKAQLQSDYETALSKLDAEQAAAQQTTDKNISLARTEAEKAAVANAEYYNAAGLSSGAKAQARLAQENQLLSNLTTLRAAQQQTDAEVDRQRSLLAKEYSSAISKAQAENDLALAQALYEEAQKAEEALLAKQEAAANLMAQTGDYSRLGALYGLSDAELQKLNGTSSGSSSTTSSTSTVDNGGLTKSEIQQLQKALNANGANLTVDGLYGSKSAAAAGGLSAKEAYEKYVTNASSVKTTETPTYTQKKNYVDALNQYIDLKKKGYTQSELDAILKELIAEGSITNQQATDIRDYRY